MMTNTKTIVRAMVVDARRTSGDYDYVVSEEWFDNQLEADYWLAFQSYARSTQPGAENLEYRKEEY